MFAKVYPASSLSSVINALGVHVHSVSVGLTSERALMEGERMPVCSPPPPHKTVSDRAQRVSFGDSISY